MLHNVGPYNVIFSSLVLLSLSFLLPVCSYNIAPPQFRSSCLSESVHFHLLITTSSSIFLSTCSNHISFASLIFSLMFATPSLGLISSFLISSIILIPIIHLNRLFLLASLAQPFSVPRSHFHVLEQV